MSIINPQYNDKIILMIVRGDLTNQKEIEAIQLLTHPAPHTLLHIMLMEMLLEFKEWEKQSSSQADPGHDKVDPCLKRSNTSSKKRRTRSTSTESTAPPTSTGPCEKPGGSPSVKEDELP